MSREMHQTISPITLKNLIIGTGVSANSANPNQPAHKRVVLTGIYMPTVLSFHLHSFSCIASLKLLIFMKLRTLCNCSSVVCPPVRGNNPRALARGLSPVQTKKK